MKRLPNNALHKALVKFLRDKQPTPVYDYVPDKIQLPYITLGAINVQDRSTKTDDITHLSIAIHIFSTYKGRFEVNNLAETIINLLAREQLDLDFDGFYVTEQGVDFYESYPEDDLGYSGVITLETTIQNVKGDN